MIVSFKIIIGYTVIRYFQEPPAVKQTLHASKEQVGANKNRELDIFLCYNILFKLKALQQSLDIGIQAFFNTNFISRTFYKAFSHKNQGSKEKMTEVQNSWLVRGLRNCNQTEKQPQPYFLASFLFLTAIYTIGAVL